jgi:RNA polymerase sigma factor (sigma-70 family)
VDAFLAPDVRKVKAPAPSQIDSQQKKPEDWRYPGVSVGIEFRPLKVDDQHDLPIQLLMDLCLRSDANEAAWNEFVKRIQSVIRGVIFNTLRRWSFPTQDAVDEVVQRTFLKLLANDCKALRMFDHRYENSFLSFLRVVASREAESYRREIARHPVDPFPESFDFPDSRVDPDRKALIEEIYAYLKTECTELECKVFHMHYKLGMAAREISEKASLNLREKEVEYILWRQMQLLRNRFGVPWEERPEK